MEKTVVARGRVEVKGATLKVVGSDSEVSIGVEPCLVGRSTDCHVVLSDTQVSKLHVELRATNEGVLVRDLGSRNGTYYHGARVREILVTSSAVLECGGTKLSLEPVLPVGVDVPRLDRFGPLIGAAPIMRLLYERLGKAARSNLSILILGETGTGKEVAARAVHEASARAAKAFVAVNCAAIAENLIESELFGHEKGAFTGADRARPGLFMEADGGTLFLDEVGEMSGAVQAKLLRVLEEREVRPVGGSRSRKVDVRVLAATRRDLAREANTEKFRSDLYFRLAQVKVELPPLRERPKDIVPLVKHMTEAMGQPAAFERITDASLERLMRHDWPGNVRELRSVIAVALEFVKDGPINLAEFVEPLTSDGERLAKRSGGRTFEDFKHDYFTELFAVTDGNVSEMSRRSGLGREAVRQNLRKYGLDERGRD